MQLPKLQKLSEGKGEKKYCLVDINIDYEDDRGRDRNKDFVIAIDCGTGAEAEKLHASLVKMNDEDEIRLSDDSDIDADDIANGSTTSHSITPGKGPSATFPKSAYQIGMKSIKFKLLS